VTSRYCNQIVFQLLPGSAFAFKPPSEETCWSLRRSLLFVSESSLDSGSSLLRSRSSVGCREGQDGASSKFEFRAEMLT
jgi:hypothetical protein